MRHGTSCARVLVWIMPVGILFGAASASALEAGDRFRFGARIGAPLTNDATAFETCSAPYGETICDGASFSIDSVDVEGGHAVIFNAYGLVKLWRSIFFGLTFAVGTGNEFESKLTGKSLEFGTDVSISPTLEWTPSITDTVSLSFSLRAGWFALMPSGDMGDLVDDYKDVCVKARGDGVGCYVEEGPVWDSQVAFSVGLRFLVGQVAVRGDFVAEAQSARDFVGVLVGAGNDVLDIDYTVNQWSRTLLMLGIEF